MIVCIDVPMTIILTSSHFLLAAKDKTIEHNLHWSIFVFNENYRAFFELELR